MALGSSAPEILLSQGALQQGSVSMFFFFLIFCVVHCVCYVYCFKVVSVCAKTVFLHSTNELFKVRMFGSGGGSEPKQLPSFGDAYHPIVVLPK